MQHKTNTVLCIGKATQDVFLTAGDVFSPHVEKDGVFAELPLGAKLDLENVIFSTGGNATNVAVTLARQGIESRYMWTLGHEPSSIAIINDLDKEGVDTTAVVQTDGAYAGYSVVMLAPTGERTILNYKGSVPSDDGAPMDLDAISHVDWVYPTSINNMTLFEAIVRRAEQAGAKVMLNPAGAELKDPERLKGMLDAIDVLCLNKEEMQYLVEGDSLEELVMHGLHYVPVVIVSDGPNGVCASDGKTIIHAGIYEDVPVIDRTGAGDAFASGFLSQWMQGRSLAESIIFASANSTSVVGQIGAKPGILHAGVELHDMPLHEKELG
jgi:ribokinase